MALDKTIQRKVKNSFERKCFQLLIEAYNMSIEKRIIQLDWNENDISSELHEYIKESQLRVKWKISTNVESHISKDIRKTKGFANRFPRIDFRLTAFISKYEYEYFFEAKRLKEKDSTLKREYIDEGIDRFVSEKYPNGSMLGYLVEGEIDKTIIGVNYLLEKDKRNSEALTFKIAKGYYESEHIGIGVLKHLIFDFTKLANM